MNHTSVLSQSHGPQTTGIEQVILADSRISSFLEANTNAIARVHDAVAWLLANYPEAGPENIIKTVERLLVPLRDNSLSFFFSYKKKDSQVAEQIAHWLGEWSAGKLEMVHMASLGIQEIGRNWRQWILKKIPECQCFLLLMPNPGEERDWPLYEAGFFSGGQLQHLAGRMICLHHVDNEVADALGPNESIPANEESVEKFLRALFHEPHWIPGMPPINKNLKELKIKAKQIVALIQQPSGPCIQSCCAPHMVVMFQNAEEMTGWEQLSKAQVKEANTACKDLFGFDTSPDTLGDWIGKVDVNDEKEGWVAKLVQGIRAAMNGEKIPTNMETLTVRGSGRVVRPIICAVRRPRHAIKRLAAIDILFIATESLHGNTRLMNPELAALAITLHFAVRFRWEVLERYSGRELEARDVLSFNKEYNKLIHQAVRDPRLQDPDTIRAHVLSLFDKDDRRVIDGMYKRWDELSPRVQDGELENAIAAMDAKRLTAIIKEILAFNQRFLELTSARFASLIAGGQSN